jgi:hypothetical protein
MALLPAMEFDADALPVLSKCPGHPFLELPE